MHYLSYTILHLVSKAYAQTGLNPCPVPDIPCDGSGTTDVYIVNSLIVGAKEAFGYVLFAMMVFYGVKLIIGADNDSTITESYHSYAFALIGTILAGAAFTLADTFATQSGDLINPELLVSSDGVLAGVILALKSLLFAAVVFNIFYQGFRLVSSQDESQTEKSKKQFIYGLVGAGIVVLASSLVNGFTGFDSSAIGVQAVGVANFMGSILGAFAVISIFVAGLYLVFAVNEQNSEKAKKVLSTAVIVLVVTIMSLALINITNQIPF